MAPAAHVEEAAAGDELEVPVEAGIGILDDGHPGELDAEVEAVDALQDQRVRIEDADLQHDRDVRVHAELERAIGTGEQPLEARGGVEALQPERQEGGRVLRGLPHLLQHGSGGGGEHGSPLGYLPFPVSDEGPQAELRPEREPQHGRGDGSLRSGQMRELAHGTSSVAPEGACYDVGPWPAVP